MSNPGPVPLISVVVPTRNRWELLRVVLDALTHQEGVAPELIEVLVVVDGSTDSTSVELERALTPFRLQVIQQQRAGAAAARNRGWKAARADLVLFLDDDVVPGSRLLAEHVNAHRDEPTAVVMGLVEQGPAVGEAWTSYDGWTMGRKYIALEAEEVPSGLHFGGNFSTRRSLLQEVGGFDSRLPRNEHVDLGYRLAQHGARFRYVAAARAEHRGHRDLEGWQAGFRLDGLTDVAMYRDRGHAGGLETIIASYHDRHWLNRALLRLALRRRFLEHGAVAVATATGIAAHRVHLRSMSRIAMSAAANLVYWGGVRDGLRGNRAFWKAIGQTRSHTRRAYQLRGRTT
jgi:GT2 family glycosyltransferase